MINIYIKLYAIKNINNSIIQIYDIIYGIMNRIIDSYKNNIISKHKYNLYLQNLENILTKFDIINYKFNIRKDKFKKKRSELNEIIKELKSLCLETGARNIFDIIYIYTQINSNYYFKNNDIIFFLNETFRPYSCKIISINTNEKTVALYDSNKNVNNFFRTIF